MYEELVKRLRWAASYDERIVIQDAKDAADVIEELQRQKDEWESHATVAETMVTNQWIPVTEWLPEYMENVLVTDGVFSGMGWRDWYDYRGTKPREDYWVAPNTNVNELNITHWMLLPEPPKAYKDGAE